MKKYKKLLVIAFITLFAFFSVSGNVFATVNDNVANTVPCSDFEVPKQLVNIVASIVKIIKIGVPIILVIMGMIDMGKAVASQKDEEIKKGQKTLISRCIAAGIVFFVVAIVQLLFNVVSPEDKDNIWSCISSFLNGPTTGGGDTTNSGNTTGGGTNSNATKTN